MIKVLDELTIDQIAAGEVIERPLSVVKELVENSIDAGSDAITIEIKGGGIESIRVTDNGCGIDKNELRTAFMRHATSKISKAEDLMSVKSLGFRGEALSSISSVTRVEIITKTHGSIVGSRFLIEGGKEGELSEIGCPDGTTIIVRDIFFNTPARKEFLKSKNTEGNAISECITQFILAHPEIRFQLIVDGKPKLKTTSDKTLKTSIFYNFGSELTKELIEVSYERDGMKLSGYIAKPSFSRGNRSYIHYYVNGRYIKNNIIQAAISDGYRDYMMQHRFPFTALMLEAPPERLDVNVHPTKKEVRFRDEKSIYEIFYHAVKEALDAITLIPEESLGEDKDHDARKEEIEVLQKEPEPFETNRLKKTYTQQSILTKSFINDLPNEHGSTGEGDSYPSDVSSRPVAYVSEGVTYNTGVDLINNKSDSPMDVDNHVDHQHDDEGSTSYETSDFLKENIFREEDTPAFRMIGQVFRTYWLIEYKDELLIIDQHAAHEKVLYEHFVQKMKNKTGMSQQLLAPIVITLSARENDTLKNYSEEFEKLGFVWEDFGDMEILITCVPADFLNLDAKDIFIDVLDTLMTEQRGKKPELILDHLATISCKAAIKGNNEISMREAETLIREMLALEEPYHCPHGRPTTIAMSRSEFERKFKRVL